MISNVLENPDSLISYFLSDFSNKSVKEPHNKFNKSVEM